MLGSSQPRSYCFVGFRGTFIQMISQTAQTVVLLSGGIDSAVCVNLLKNRGHNVRGLFVDYGQAASAKEAETSRAIADYYDIDLQTISLSAGRNFCDGEVVGRNAFLVFAALMSSGITAGRLVLGIHQGTDYFDCTPAFANSIDVLLSEHSDGAIRLVTPLLQWNKSDIFEYCRREGIPVRKTYSCERGTMPTCGICRSCLDRLDIDAGKETLG